MSAEKPRVLIVGASPDAINLNAQSRSYLSRGFQDLLSPEHVKATPFEYGADAIAAFSPHLVLVFGSCYPDGSDYSGLKRSAASAKAHLAFWLHDDPYEFDYNFRATDVADTIFTNDKWAKEYYRFERIFHLPMAACPHAHYRDLSMHSNKKFDLFFVGAAFENRVRLIHDFSDSLDGYRICIRGSGWPEGIPGCQNGFIANEQIADYYAKSWTVLNVGRDLDLGNERYRLPATTPGPRTFEAAMAGCVQLYFVTGLEIEEYFEPESEIVLFDHADEVPDLLDSIVGNPERAMSIASAAQKRALRDHSYAERAKRILEECLPDWSREHGASVKSVRSHSIRPEEITPSHDSIQPRIGAAKRLVLVTGTGRCGTSVVSNALYSSGFDMGDPEDMLVADEGNRRGYWENRRVMSINKRILEANGIEWGQIPRSLPLDLPSDLEFEMRDLLQHFSEEFCCKDPRFVWTADLWARLAQHTVLIAAFRSPAGFVQSVARLWPTRFSVQSGLQEEGSSELAIWEESNKRLLDLSDSYPCFWICFDDPIELLKKNLQSIIETLGKAFNPSQFDEFFIPSERHFSSSTYLDLLAHSRFEELYSQLRQKVAVKSV